MTGRRQQPETKPGHAVAEGGTVVLDGPGSVAVSMTPDCASGTADSLRQAADTARQQGSGD